MLINFTDLITRHQIKPKGIIHIGGSHGEEFLEYEKNKIENQVWIEAIPKYYEIMKNTISSNKNARPFCACISDENFKEVEFKITGINAGQSSSFLEMGTHQQIHPGVDVTEIIKMRTITLDLLLYNNDINPYNYDFLNMDIQGAEIFALRGMVDTLQHINYIYCEFNESEVYKGAMLLPDFDKYLESKGFERVELKYGVPGHWGDAFYKRKN